MKSKKTFGLVMILAGVAMVFCSMYISGQVAEGRGELSEAQSKVDRGSGLFNMNPVTKQVGKGITGAAQRKIDAYGREADAYEQLAMWLKIGGIVLIVAGAGVLFSAARTRT